MKAKIFALIGVLVLVVLGVYFFMGGEKKSAMQAQAGAQMPPAPVTVYTVKPENITFTKDLPGRTSAYQVAEIRPQVSGIILRRLFTEGSYVKAGQQLYQIDPATYQAAYDSAVASLESAQANYNAIAPKAKRYAELVKVGGVSQQDYDDAMSSMAQAKASIAVAQAAVKTARINLNYTKVFAPISGRIGKSSVTEGALVTASQATALATIQNLDKIYVDVNQSSTDLMKLRKQISSAAEGIKTTADLVVDGDSEAYGPQGTIQFSEVTVDQGTGDVQLRILFPNPSQEILPGLFVKARIAQSKQEGAITIPQQSLVRNADGSTTVWAVDKTGTVNVKPVTVSKVVGDRWLVTGGLATGDKVVVEGLQKIAPGAKVAATEVQPAGK